VIFILDRSFLLKLLVVKSDISQGILHRGYITSFHFRSLPTEIRLTISLEMNGSFFLYQNILYSLPSYKSAVARCCALWLSNISVSETGLRFILSLNSVCKGIKLYLHEILITLSRREVPIGISLSCVFFFYFPREKGNGNFHALFCSGYNIPALF
jgi:hypothetical protein